MRARVEKVDVLGWKKSGINSKMVSYGGVGGIYEMKEIEDMG